MLVANSLLPFQAVGLPDHRRRRRVFGLCSEGQPVPSASSGLELQPSWRCWTEAAEVGTQGPTVEAGHSQVSNHLLPNGRSASADHLRLLCFRMDPSGLQWLTPGLRKCKCASVESQCGIPDPSFTSNVFLCQIPANCPSTQTA